MPLFRPSTRPADDYDLATPEETGRRRRRRRFVLVLAVLAALVAAGTWQARPAYRLIKGWQARRIAAQAQSFTKQERWAEATAKVQDAMALAPTDPEVIHAAGTLLTRLSHGREAAGFWKQLETIRPLTSAEQRDYATALFILGDLDGAAARLRLAWPEGQEGTPADWWTALQIAWRQHQTNDAASLAGRIVAAPASTDRQRFDAAQVLVSNTAADKQSAGWAAIETLAAGASPQSLDALVLLSREAVAAAAAAKEGKKAYQPTEGLPSLIERIEKNPFAKVTHQLLALDLRLAQDPARRAELIQTAIDRFANGDNEALATLSAWLYAKGEFNRVLTVLPLAKATGSRTLYLQYLDNLGALGRWQEIKDTIEGQKFGLDPVSEQMYLARCSAQLGQSEGRDLHWNAAVKAAGVNVDLLLTVGNYAQRGGAPAPAEAAFRAALQASPDSYPAHEALLGLLEAQGRTVAVREVLADMMTRWPKDTSVRNDDAYIDLLLKQNLAGARNTARELVRAEPASLPHRVTLALAELRTGNGLAALDAFSGVTPSALTEARFLAVYAAALWETGYYGRAREAARQIVPERLLPEERELIQSIQ